MTAMRLATMVCSMAPLLVCAGCVGEASVSYQGTVTEGAVSGHAFDDAPNPTAASPIAGATVELCVDRCPGESVTTAADGAFAELEQVFGGFAGGDTRIIVRATAPDGRAVTYEVIYEDTSDPTIANPSCERPCPPVFLNLRLAP